MEKKISSAVLRPAIFAVVAMVAALAVAAGLSAGVMAQEGSTVECMGGTGPLELVEQSGDVRFGDLTVTLPADRQFAAHLDEADNTLTICDVATENFIIIKTRQVGLLARSADFPVLNEVFRSLTLPDGSQPFATTTLPAGNDIAPPITGDGGLLD